ncbi:MAG: hypothetical protein E7543_08165 [Ruminococcaceae bacterium]|nr:hypothetical protein [Oscillospiraceae bacterium]
MKKSVKIIISVLLIPCIFSVTVMLVNDIAANKTEKELSVFPLPEKTQLAETNSVAGKLYGNGNGMQYIGQLLVTTELTEEELYAHYSEVDEYIVIKKMDSPVISEYFPKQEFKSFDSTKNNYMVELVRYNPGTFDSYFSENFFWKLLDCDIRGH